MILAGKPWTGSKEAITTAAGCGVGSASASVFSALCYRWVQAESAGFHPQALGLCPEGNDVIPSRGKMWDYVSSV